MNTFRLFSENDKYICIQELNFFFLNLATVLCPLKSSQYIVYHYPLRYVKHPTFFKCMVPLLSDSQIGPPCNPVLLVLWAFFLRNEIAKAFSCSLPN
jgi:hypothetical protein